MKSTATMMIDAEAIARPESGLSPMHVVGWLITAVFPALFWTGVIAFAAPLFGLSLSAMALAVTAGSIGLFLTMVYVAVVLGASRS